MPNRKTFDERERYDHSGRPLSRRQKNDLGPGLSERTNGAENAPVTGTDAGSPASAPGKQPRGPDAFERRRGGRETGG